jgi:hypothetical protein
LGFFKRIHSTLFFPDAAQRETTRLASSAGLSQVRGNMPTDPTEQTPPAEKRPLTPEAERALAEAAARRAEHQRQKNEPTKEQGGRGGLDPTRYGDWEKDGLTSDF